MDIEKLAGRVYTTDESGLPYGAVPYSPGKRDLSPEKKDFFLSLHSREVLDNTYDGNDHSDNTDNQH